MGSGIVAVHQARTQTPANTPLPKSANNILLKIIGPTDCVVRCFATANEREREYAIHTSIKINLMCEIY